MKAALHDPAGNEVEERDNISQAHQFVAAPKDSSGGDIWSLSFDKAATGVLEDFYVQFQGVPPVLAPMREELLRPAK